MTVVALMIFAIAVFVASRSVVAMIGAWKGDSAYDRSLEEDSAMREVRELLSRKTMLLQLIRQTELDLSEDRIESEEAQRVIQRYRREAVVVMRRLDELQGTAEDIEAARERMEERRDQAFLRYQAGEGAWSSVAARRHGDRTSPSEGAQL